MTKMTALPGDARQRITELRLEKGLNQKELAKAIRKEQRYNIDESTVSRIENGDVHKIGHELLAALSRYFQVSADYILGLTDDRLKTSYEIKELGLSYEAARRLVTGTVNSDAVNRLIETPEFPLLSELISEYFNSSMFEEYARLRQLLPDPKTIEEETGDFSSDINKEKCRAMLEMFTDLQEPMEMRKYILQKQFSKILDSLVAALEEGYDPEQMTQEQINRELRQELYKLRHHADIRNPSAEESAKALTRVASRQLALNAEERSKFEDLFLTMMNNRKMISGNDQLRGADK